MTVDDILIAYRAAGNTPDRAKKVLRLLKNPQMAADVLAQLTPDEQPILAPVIEAKFPHGR